MATQGVETGLSSQFLTPDILGDGIVSLYVGPKRKKLDAHKKLLCDNSNFFSAAFNGSFKEANEGEMYMPEDDPDTLALIITYLYRGIIILPTIESKTKTIQYIELYSLAEKLCITNLMDQTIDALRLHMASQRKRLGRDLGELIYRATCGNSKIRRYFVASTACYIARYTYKTEWTEECMLMFDQHPDVYRDIFLFQLQHSQKIPSIWPKRPYDPEAFSDRDPITFPINACEFHTHKEGEACYLKTGATTVIPTSE